MTQYRRGYEIELRAKKVLESQGYFVIRSAGSKGPVDLVAIKGKEVKLIQVKRVKSRKSSYSFKRQEEFLLPFEIWIWIDEERRWEIWRE